MEKKLTTDTRKVAQLKVAYMRELNGTLSRYLEARKMGIEPRADRFHSLTGTINNVMKSLNKILGVNGNGKG